MSVQDGLPTPARYYAMVVVLLGITMTVLDGTIVNLALPRIAHDLQTSAANSVWIVNAYQVSTLALLLPCATLGDLVGYRRIYLSGLLLFTLASLGCTLADSLPTLAAARAVQGLGAAGVMSVNSALVRLIYPERLLGRGMAINSMVVASAAVAGPSLAAAILSVAAWPWLFAVNLPLGATVLWLGFRVLPRNPAERPRQGQLCWLDVVLNALMFGLLFLGIDAVGAAPKLATALSSRLAGLVLLAVAIPLGAVYLRRQWHQTLPIFPVDLLRIPVFALSMCTSITAFAAQTLAYIALPFLLLDAYGHSPAQAGLLITAWPLTIVVVAPLAGLLIGRYPDGLLGGVGLGLFALGLATLALQASLPTVPENVDIVWRLMLCGAGFGLFQSPNNHTIVTSAPLARSGAASGMLGTARLTGQTTGAVLMAVIFSVTNAHDGRGPLIALTLAACLAALAGASSALRLRYPGAAH